MAQVQLLKVRIAFPALFEAKTINEGDAKFGANFIIEPGSKNAKALAAAMISLTSSHFARTKPPWPRTLV